MIDCCNRVMRPYAVASPAISSRMLSVHGRGATMPTATMMGMERRAQQFLRTAPAAPPPPPVRTHRRSVDRATWAAADHATKAALVASHVISPPSPLFSTSLPERFAQSQKRACNGRRPVAHTCAICRSLFLVAFHIPGLRVEALGNVITNSWHCPVCEGAPRLAKVDLVGQLVHATNGIFGACRSCAVPVLYSPAGLVCAECSKDSIEEIEKSERLAAKRCWSACHRRCVQEFMVIPPEGIDEGQPWPRLHACPVHSLPDTSAPVPYEDIRRIWWHSRSR